MVIQKIHNVLLGNRFYGIELLFTDNGNEYYVTEIEKQKNNLSIQKEFSISNFEELNTVLDKKYPIIISFTGQNIITKTTSNEVGYRSKILFNANEDEFYWYELETDNNIFVSVARKETIDTQMDLFKANGYSCIDYSLGPIPASIIHPLINNQPSEIHTNTHTLSFNNSEINNITKNDTKTDSYQISEDTINSQSITSFATVINYFFPNPTVSYDKIFLKESTDEFKYQQAFKYVGIGALSFFLITLLISFFTLDYYQNELQEVQQELSLQSSAYNQVLSLEEDKKNKKAILIDSGLNDTHFISFYVNEITKNIPKKINLDQLDVFPVTKKIKNKQRIEFLSSQITILGTADNNSVFSEWIQTLKKMNWIKNIEITDFEKEKRRNSFAIKLTLN